MLSAKVRTLTFLLLNTAATVAVALHRHPRLSRGCEAVSDIPGRGEIREGRIRITDPQLDEIERTYVVGVPEAIKEPLALWLVFHGQNGKAGNYARNTGYIDLGAKNGFMAVFPQGLNDHEEENCGNGWNAGFNKKGCTSKADSSSCCYQSCRKLGLCTGDGAEANCGWSTCYDDAHFTSKLIDHIGDTYCVDLNNVIITGASNGGMVAHRIAADIPDKIAAVVPLYGLPLVDQLIVPPALSKVPYIYLSGRHDLVVPIDGEESEDGWLYVTLDEAAGQIADMHQCDVTTVRLDTPFDRPGRDINFECSEFPRCKTEGVAYCLYDGAHHTPDGLSAPEITLWFIKKYLGVDNTMLKLNATGGIEA